MKQLYILLLFHLVISNCYSQENYMLVGTYDSPKSKGIYVYKFDERKGSAVLVSHIKTSNASYLAVSPDQRFVFSVNENNDKKNNGGSVTSFSFDQNTGTLTEINQQQSAGNDPCYITTDYTGRWIIAGNYSSGNFSLLPVSKDGMLGPAKQVIDHQGSGPDTTRQTSPHVHGVFLKKNNKNLYVTDLGTDKIYSYKLNVKKGKIKSANTPFTPVKPGNGPRHIAFSPNEKFVYLLQELSGSISVFADHGRGDLELIQSISSVPASYTGAAGSADIHVSPDGRFLYASNRGQSNTIAIFSIDQDSGKIALVGFQDTMGLTPRNFNFDPSGNYLLVANQNSDDIVVFKRNLETGLLTFGNNIISVDKPVCIKWITAHP